MKKVDITIMTLLSLALFQFGCSKSETGVPEESFVPNEDLVGVWFLEYVDVENQDFLRRREYTFTSEGKREMSFTLHDRETRELLGYKFWSESPYTTKHDTISYGHGITFTYNADRLPYPSKEDLLSGERQEYDGVLNAETFKLIEEGTKLDITYLRCDDVADCPEGIVLTRDN